MNDDMIQMYVQKIGMACFMTHLEVFADSGRSNSNVADLLVEADRIKRSSATTKVSKARAIIAAGATRKAVERIAGAQKVDAHAIRAARRWLTENPR